MAALTIRNLDEAVKNGLRVQAAQHGCSMEEEVRRILRQEILKDVDEKGLGHFIHQAFAEAGGVELSIPPRSIPRHSGLFEDEYDSP